MNVLLDHVIILLIAILIDVTLGDPPEKIENYYPIVWISRLMYCFDRRTKRGNERREKILGVVFPVVILSMFALPCLMLLRIPSELVYILLGSLVFKMTFTVKGLERYGRYAAGAGDLEEKRAAVGKIVSRDVSDLDREHLDSAAVESVAENTTDSVISPLFYFALFGVFGAMCYRVVNTLDAVVGYKSRRYKHFGWFSAKADDVLNYIPERVAAGLILLLGGSKRGELSCYDTEKVPLTIAAMSHALHVKLEKVGHYTVGECFEEARSEHICEAIRMAKGSMILFAFFCGVVMTVLYVAGWSWLKPFP
jgi:adenosylcobinamide-phosphate synthase